MYKIALINMPFASLGLPSLALTQLKAVVEGQLKDRVSVDIFYLNMDFADYLGLATYQRVTNSPEVTTSGLGDWFFRQAAFPDAPDNTEAYFQRYYNGFDPRTQGLRRFIKEKRQGLEAFLDGVIDKYGLDQVDMVGFTSMFSQNAASFALARKIKARAPGVIVVIGGANCEAPMGQEIVKNVKSIDYVFSGPSLVSFPQFVQHRVEGEAARCEVISGVFSKKNHLLRPLNTVSGEELDIDAPIDLDYEPFLQALESHFPAGAVKPTLLFQTSRGCWWGEKAHCTFCGLNGTSMKYKAMSPERAIQQFEAIFKYVPRCLAFESVDNILAKNYFKEVFPFINTPPDVSIFYEVKADLKTEEMEILSKAGVSLIQPGIEALATSTLKLMKKGTTAFQNVHFLKDALAFDIAPDWNLLVGFPGEDEAVYKKYVSDIPLLFHLPAPSGAFPVRFDRYSPYFVRAKEYDLNLHPLDFYKLVYPFSQESLANLAYFFSDYNFSADYIGKMTRWINLIREQVTLWQRRWFAPDPALRAKLVFKHNGYSTVIVDSRGDRPVEYRISSTLNQLLQFLSKPKRLSDIANEMSGIPDFDPHEALAHLRKLRLVFEEGERLMSLVVEEPVAAESRTA